MTSATLLDEIANEARLHNPNATTQQVSDGIVAIISKEILPGVLRNLSLPRFPSYRSTATAEARSAKRTRRTRTDVPVSLDHRRRVIQQIEHVRIQMSWDGGDDLTPKPHVIDSPYSYYTPKIDLPQPRENLRKEEVKEKTDSKEESKPVDGTFQKMMRQPEKNLIVLSETAQRKIVSEPIFEAVFKNVEVQLRSIIASRKLETEIDVTCKNDDEIPSWNKCIFRVHPPPDLDFNTRMNLSTIFDIAIRKTINDLKKNADSNATEYLQKLNRNLFVHVDL
jgi:hypothetical protein